MRTWTLERVRWVILALLFFSTVINYVDRQTLSVLLPTLRQAFHMTSAQYGSISTAFLLAYTVAQIPAGAWLDRIGTRIGFAWFVGVWSAAAMLQALTRGVWSLAAVRSVLGLSEAGNWPAGAKSIALWFPQERRAVAMAIFDGGSAAGAIAAPPLVALIALHYGWRAAFAGTGLIGFVWLSAWLWLYRSPEAHALLTPAEKLVFTLESGGEVVRAPVLKTLRKLMAIRQLWGLMFTRLLATPIWWFYVFWLPDYLSKGRGFSLRQIGLYAWIPFLTVDVGKVFGGSVSDALLGTGRSATFARKSVMLAGACCMMSGILVVGAPNAIRALLWACVATFGFGLWSANILALHADVFPAFTLGSAVGVTGTAASLGGAGFTYIVGQLVDARGYGSAFWATGVLAFFACLALIWGVGEVKRVELRSVDATTGKASIAREAE